MLSGNDKFKNCVIGTFTKYSAPSNTVSSFATNLWTRKGLVSVSQKSNSTFIFKFDSEIGMNAILSRGTWYVGKKPMVVTAWGSSISSWKIKNIPLWVKISNIPDCYWTIKGLSRLASVVGPLLCADQLTSKLEVLPFAKVCVNYKIGDSLPNSVNVHSLDPVTKEKLTSEVLFSYPNKPLMCNGCLSLGHTIGACPNATRTWVQKSKPVEVKPVEENVEENLAENKAEVPVGKVEQPAKVSNPSVESVNDDTIAKEDHRNNSTECIDTSKTPEGGTNEDEGWKTVLHNKRSKPEGSSATTKSPKEVHAPIFKSIARALNKNPPKRGKKGKGRGSPS